MNATLAPPPVLVHAHLLALTLISIDKHATNGNYSFGYEQAWRMIVGQKKAVLFPKTISILQRLGENIRLARLRRNISSSLQAERAGISRPTLTMIEKGAPSVALGNYVQVLVSLGLEKDLLKVAADDELGRSLQDLNLSSRQRASKQ